MRLQRLRNGAVARAVAAATPGEHAAGLISLLADAGVA
jgi:hypothetical protein